MNLALAVDAMGALTVAHLAYTSFRMSIGTAQTVSAITESALDHDTADIDGTHRYLVLLPMLREERIAADICAHFLPVVKENPKVDVVVVTSLAESDERAKAQETIRSLTRTGYHVGSEWHGSASRAVQPEAIGVLQRAVSTADMVTVEELLDQRQRPTTAEVITPIIEALNARAGRPAFHHVSVDMSATSKVAKLNAAVAAWFSTATHAPDNTYIGVYDADSAPDPATFRLIDKELHRRRTRQEKPPELFQQVSCYCRQLPNLSGPKRIFALADAIAQTRWALGFEYPLYTSYSRRVRQGRLRPLAYCVGHGCFVSSQFLTRIGGFPSQSPTDDLALGYVASTLGAEISAIPALDFCEVAPDPVASMRQSRFWFSGSARYFRDIRYARAMLGARPTRCQLARLHLAGLGRNVAWAGRGVAWLMSLSLAIVTTHWWMLAVIALAGLIYVQLGYVQTIRAIRRLPNAADATGLGTLRTSTLLLAAFAATPTFVLRSLGPLTGAIETLRREQAGVWKHER